MADSDIVIWFAEHHCFGDVLVARRLVARWTVSEAHRWLRVAFGDEAKVGSDERAAISSG